MKRRPAPFRLFSAQRNRAPGTPPGTGRFPLILSRRARIALALMIFWLALLAGLLVKAARGYSFDYTVPSAGGCPARDRFDTAATAINRRWSTSLASPPTILTVAAQGTSSQLDEIEQTILAAFGAWAGVAGTTVNTGSFPGSLTPLGRTSVQNACANDQATNLTGLNTICFNQASAAFTTGVLAFTRIFTATAAGQSAGSSAPAAFPGQILEADILFRDDGQDTFATPGALANNPGSFDLESLLIHELGHFFGLGHSPVWRAAMFPFAPPPGTFLAGRPSPASPDAPLADDDRTGLRALYPDPNDTVHTGEILGRVVPANPLALARLTATSANRPVTGIFGAHVVAVDASTGAVVAGVVAGWSCDPANPPPQFDGGYEIERLAVGKTYQIYAEPLIGLVQPGNLDGAFTNLCSTTDSTPCLTPPVNTDFVSRTLPAP
jgi:Matrixin